MKYNFDEIVNRRGTGSTKWDGSARMIQMGRFKHFDEQSIPLFTADMDLPVPQPVVEAIKRTADNRIFGYSITTPEYIEAIQGWFKRHYDWDIPEEQLVYSAGTSKALYVGVRAFTEEGDGVIVQPPVYSPFANTVRNANRKVVNNNLICEDGIYSLDLVDFEQKAKDPNNKMFVLCNPHNPTGNIWSPAELKKMAELCYENDVIILADEIHGDLLRCGNQFTPIATTTEHNDHIISCTAINKTFNMAGLHCTNLVIPTAELREKFELTRGYQDKTTPFISAALIAAYNEGQDWLDQLKVYLDGTIDWVLEYVAENMPKVAVQRPQGTYVMWFDFSGYGLTDDEVFDKICEEANVIISRGAGYGPGGEGHMRICISSPRPMIKEAFQRIAKVFEKL